MDFDISPLALAAKQEVLKKRNRWMSSNCVDDVQRSYSVHSGDSSVSFTSAFGNEFSEEDFGDEKSDEDSDSDIGFSTDEDEEEDTAFLEDPIEIDDDLHDSSESIISHDRSDKGALNVNSSNSEKLSLPNAMHPLHAQTTSPASPTRGTLDSLSEAQLNKIARAYAEHKTAVLRGNLLVTRSEVCLLAALQVQIEFGAFVTRAMLDLKLVLPSVYTTTKGIQDQIFNTQEQFKEISDTKARVLYIAACRQSPLYKCREHFIVAEKVRGKTKPSCEILGITGTQLLIIDTVTFSIVNAFDLSSIRRWNTKTDGKRPSITFEMKDNASELRFFTTHCVAISSSVAAHLSKARLASCGDSVRSAHVSTWRDSVSLASFGGADSAYGGSRGGTPHGGTPVGATPEIQRRIRVPKPTSPLSVDGSSVPNVIHTHGGTAKKKRWSQFLSPLPQDPEDKPQPDTHTLHRH